MIPQENIGPIGCFKKSAVSLCIASDQRYDNNLCFISLKKHTALALRGSILTGLMYLKIIHCRNSHGVK